MATQLTLTNGGLLMTVTEIQLKAVLNLLNNASTGNELLTILDWFVNPQPTVEEIEF
jgi:hypothetical protein